MEKKLYVCEIESCGRKVIIRSTIRTGEYKGKKACSGCKARYEKKVKKITQPIERVSYSGFFDNKITLLKIKNVCDNCGCKINANFMPHANIAHILPKSRYKSVATHPDNFLFLCSGKTDAEIGNCHYKFDNQIKNQEAMPVWDLAKQRFQKFKHLVTENIGDDFIKLDKI